MMRGSFDGYARWALRFVAWVETATLGMVLALAALAILTNGDRAFGDLPKGMRVVEAVPSMVFYSFIFAGVAQLPALAAVLIGYAALRYRGIDAVSRPLALLACTTCAAISVAFWFSALTIGGQAGDLVTIPILLAVPWLVTGALSGAARGQTR